MANQVNIAGLAAIKVDTGAAHALELLGYTRDGAQITFDGFFHDVPTDENGGEAGPPTDVQYMGETAKITLRMSKYDPAVADKVVSRVYGTAAGTVSAVGTLMIGGGFTYRLLIHSPTTPFNFLTVMFREAIEINKGTKFSELLVVGTAYKNASNVLYNAVVV